jgi:RNA polymerase sigma-70 factor (ECF subfamily)
MPLQVEDEALVRRALEGDREAFGELADRHAAGVYHLALQMLRHPAEAEEVLQDTFLAAYKRLGTFRGESRFKTWLYQIATNHARMKLRRRRRAPETVELEEWSLPEPVRPWRDLPAEAFERLELRRLLTESLESLPEIYRTAFWLRDVEGLSNQEVADVLGLTLPAVKSRVLRARLALRDRLAPYLEESADGR